MSMSDLEAHYRESAKRPASVSYTRKLLDEGLQKCAKKLGEEAVEAVIAALAESDEKFVAECSDVQYHMIVLLHARGLSFSLVEKELLRRREKSGLEEKASRQS